jgi:hypothetical protein
VPEAKVVTLPTIGFCNGEENPFGPLHEYVAPIKVVEVKLKDVPEQTGELLPIIGVVGGGLTMTVVLPAGPVHPFRVAITK